MNPIPGPVILLATLLAAAGITYLLRRWTLLVAPFATATTGILAFFCLRLPLDRSAFVLGREVAFGRPVMVLGQTLRLEPAGQLWLAFAFGLTAVTYLLAWRTSQGRSFFSFGLGILALYVLMVLLEVFALAVLVFAVSVSLAVFILQAGQLSSVRGAQRYLVVSLLAVPFLLIAQWLVDPSIPTAQSVEMTRRALLPAALGFGLLLAAFPFGTWMPAVAVDAPPIVTAFVFTVGQAMALFLAFIFWREYPLLLSDPIVPAVVQVAGLVMVVSGGIMAAVQRDLGRLFGYAALSDLGILLMAIGAGGSQSVDLTLLHLVSRSVSITLMAAGLAILRHRAATDRFADLQGVARRLPLATVGVMLGGLALAGFPLTAGFPSHWAVARAVAGEQWMGGAPAPWALVLVASSLGIIVGLLRGLNAMLGTDPREDVARQPIVASLMVLALAGLSIVLGLYPQLFLEPIQRAAQAFSLF